MTVKKTANLMMTALILGSVALMGTGCSVASGLTGSEINLTKSFDGKTISNLDIQTNSTPVHLVETSSDQIQVALKGSVTGDEKTRDQMLTASVNGSELVVNVQQADSVLWKIKNVQLTVQVPKKLYDKIRVQTSAGDIVLEDGLEANDLELTASSGNVQVAGYKGNLFDVETHSGDINLNQMSGKGQLKASAGDVKVTMASLTQGLSIETSSGDATVSLPEKSVFRLDAQTHVKDAKINFPLVKNVQEDDHLTGSANSATGDAPLLDVKTSSGHFDLEKAM